jgi:biopolymer transport protein ExbD
MKRSLRAARMERHHKRFGKATLSLVSLMDIFTILVFFLLVNSSDVQQIPNSKSIKLPPSLAEELPKDNLVVMVNNQQILVRGRPVANVDEVLSSDERTIPALKKELEYQASLVWDKEKLADVDGAEITVMGDKAIPYKLVEKIMATMAETPYKTIYFAVARKEKERP